VDIKFKVGDVIMHNRKDIHFLVLAMDGAYGYCLNYSGDSLVVWGYDVGWELV
jgi:hypothetical protein